MKNIFKLAGAGIALLAFTFASAAGAADAKLRPNHEAMRFRLAAEEQTKVMNTLREALHLCNMLFPVRMAAISKRDPTVANAEKIYKEMLAMKSSAEIFKWLLDFLSEDEALRTILQKTFVRAEDGGERRETPLSFRLNKTEFYVRWFWLYPTKEGLLFAAQDEMTRETADEIWDTQFLYPVYELHFPIPTELRESPFWEKGAMKIIEAFPSAHVAEEPSPELIYPVFPDSSGIPNIVRRSAELLTD